MIQSDKYLSEVSDIQDIIKPYRNSSSIVFGVSDELSDYKKNASDVEEKICGWIRSTILKNRQPKYEFEIAHKSTDYTTLVYRKSDIVRVKWTPAAKWMAIQINSSDLVKKYKDDPRFDSQKNKNVIQWKTMCSKEQDIANRMDIIFDSYDDVDNWHYEAPILSEEEKEYVVAVGKVIANVSGDWDHIYYQKTTTDLRVSYKGSVACVISFKLYKKKSHRCYLKAEDAIKLKLYTGKEDEYPGYIEFNDPDFFQSLVPYIQKSYDYCIKMAKYYIPKEADLELYGDVKLDLK